MMKLTWTAVAPNVPSVTMVCDAKTTMTARATHVETSNAPVSALWRYAHSTRRRIALDFESCDDGVQNQDETDVDCGGMSCLPCDIAMTCNDHRDCISGICKRKKCIGK
jgi:hypothetical protein